MKARQLKIFAWTLFSIIFSTLIFFGIVEFSNYVTGRTPDFNVPDEFFGILSSTIGLAIAASASIIAIVLAYNALHSADIQTTTVALQEFRGEIEAFVGLANEYYETSSRLVSHSLKLQKLSEEISFLAEDEPEIESNQVIGVLKMHNETLANFHADVEIIQRLITGSGNIFFRGMMNKNYEKFSSYTNNLIDRCKNYSQGNGQYVIPYPISSITVATPEINDPAIVKQLGKFSRPFTLLAFSEYDSEEYIQRQGATVFLASSLDIGEDVFEHDGLEAIKSLSKFLPCVVSTQDFDLNSDSELDATGKPYKKSEFDQIFDLAESAEDYVRLTSRSTNSLDAYSDILPFYLAMADPTSGIDEVRSFFINFGAKEDALRLFIDTHAARLMFSYRAETNIVFIPCITGVSN